MLQVSIIVELLRTWPQVVFWLAAAAQAALWFLVPTLFYAAPPGDLPFVLAVGREFLLGTYLGPPLAFWLAELMFRLTGGSAVGVYLLAQICVLVTYWAVFALGRSIVGATQAAIATLLMVGIASFALPTPEFGPAILAMPLTALIVLHLWRALGEGNRNSWFLLAFEIGLLLLTTYSGLILVALIVAFIGLTERGRTAINSTDPWMAGIVVVIVLFPHLIWLDVAGDVIMPALQRLHSAEAADTNLVAWLRIVGMLVLAHAGLVVLVLLASVAPRRAAADVPVFTRAPLDPFARQYVFVFAFVPALVATLLGAIVGAGGPVGGTPPLVVLSGLLVVVALGPSIRFYRQQVVGIAWLALLVTPPLLAMVAVLALPWTVAVDLPVMKPAREMGRFFAENFERRNGQRLRLVTGDARTAALVALGAPSRPSLFLYETPQRSSWVNADDVMRRGAVVVWIATDTEGAVPPEIRQRFPDLVAEVPRRFDRRPVDGRLPLLRIGWGVIRPAGAPAAQ